jgi:eukaryotic-like serine/threonine-protein kinase
MRPAIAPERWQLIEELFHSSLERGPRERDIFLMDACGDDIDLRRQVEALLDSYEAADGFIDVPPLAGAISSVVAETAKETTPTTPGITPGGRIAHYEIRSLLGVGGMGDVYLAHDLKLDRQIALKILPARFIDDAQVHRFEREARAASALNHPNIITIHEIGWDQDIHYIATEFVTGQTLRERINDGGIELRETLSIAIQVLDALIAAHATGIVHRDIKPENVMLRPDGLVKVLDFGLAKPTAENPKAANLMVTEVTLNTDPSMLMGTLSYLSPEQVLRQEVDHRTDLFSFGVLLYEMVTGGRPFIGDSAVNVCSAILSQTPENVTLIRPDMPAELERIILQALEKDRGKRYQTAVQMRADLESLNRELQVTSQRSWRVVGWKSALIVAAVLTVLLWQIQSITRKNKPVSAAGDAQVTIKRLTSHGQVLRAALSPDGKRFAYVKTDETNRSLWLGQTSDGSCVPLQQQSSNVLPGTLIFSPDGEQIYYIGTTPGQGFSTLYRMPVNGGETHKVLDHIDSQLTFSPDGEQIAFVRIVDFVKRENALVVARLEGASERVVTVREWSKRFTASGPSWSPDGKMLAVGCIGEDNGTTANKEILAVRVSDGTINSISREKWDGVYRLTWLPDGSGLIMIATDKPGFEWAQVWHLSYPGGKAHRITRDLDQYDQSNLSLSADGRTLLAVQLRRVNSIWLAPAANIQDARQLTFGSPGSAMGVYGLEWAPDGRIFYQVFAGEGISIWSMAPDGSSAKEITSPTFIEKGFSLPSSGDQIVFPSNRGGALEVWRSDLDGGRAQCLTSGGRNSQPHVAPDGRWVIYSSSRGLNNIWRVSTDGGEPFRLTDAETMWPRLSPDGKLFACVYRASLDKPWQLALYSSEGGLPLKIFDRPRSANFATGLRWTLDGQAITYRDWNDGVWRQPLTGEPPQRLPGLPKEKVYSYAWSPDGKYFAFTRGTESLDVVLIRDFK